MSASFQTTAQSNVGNRFPNDTLDILFNEKDGILTNPDEKETETLETNANFPSDPDAFLPDIDLDSLLNSGCEENGNRDIFEQILASPDESSSSPNAESSLGSPPFLQPSTPTAVANLSVVSQDHAYLPADTIECDFQCATVEEIKFTSPRTSGSCDSSPHTELPLYIGDDLDCLESRQRSAPGPIRHGRRSRGSGSSNSGLPYTIHDIPISSGSPSSDSHFDDDLTRSSGGGRYKADDAYLGAPGESLVLTDEERYLLVKEGMVLPDRLPLTREEERVLRTIRRKIRNKISAKNSRLKKQEYVVGLEQRVKECSKENRSLRGAVDSLRSQNRQLIVELRRLKQWVSTRVPSLAGIGDPHFRGGAGKAGLYVVFLSLALIVTPFLSPFWTSPSEKMMTSVPIGKPSVLPGRTRTLLQEREAAVDIGDPYHITVRPAGPPWQNPPKTAAISLPPAPPVSSPTSANGTAQHGSGNASTSDHGESTEDGATAAATATTAAAAAAEDPVPDGKVEEEADLDLRGDEL